MNAILDVLRRIGGSGIFLLLTLRGIPGALLKPRLLAQQIYSVGNRSLIIMVVSGMFVGMVLALQAYRAFVNFGAEESIGTLIGLSLTRELGPVMTALLFAGRAGSALAAEIGLMRATEQLDGLEMMAVDPIQRIVAPRFVAGMLAMPILVAIFIATAAGVLGGHLVGVELLGVDAGSYWAQMQASVNFQQDVIMGMTKAFFFGIAITWIALYQGYYAAPNSEGVGRATTNTVVVSSLVVLGLNFILTALMFSEI